MYDLFFEKRALNFINKLDNSLKQRIWDKLLLCKENPFRFLEHLEQIKGYKLRVGDYRVILDVDRQNNRLVVLRIGHRRDIYD
jgi:mRNA interferase RelE/StbE